MDILQINKKCPTRNLQQKLSKVPPPDPRESETLQLLQVLNDLLILNYLTLCCHRNVNLEVLLRLLLHHKRHGIQADKVCRKKMILYSMLGKANSTQHRYKNKFERSSMLNGQFCSFLVSRAPLKHSSEAAHSPYLQCSWPLLTL